MKVINKDLEHFNYFLEQIKAKKIPFKITETNYTKSIEINVKKFFFSDEKHLNGKVLNLISKVKKDAEFFIEKEYNGKLTKPTNIVWYAENPKHTDFKGVVYKVDLNAAYWIEAYKMGVISKETLKYYDNIKFKSNKERKQARLKALGSLATIKKIREYDNKGNLISESIKYNPLTRNLYLTICKNIGGYLSEYLKEFDAIYMYWDCFFMEHTEFEKNKENIYRKLKDDGFNFTFEIDYIEVISQGLAKGVYSREKKKAYPLQNFEI